MDSEISSTISINNQQISQFYHQHKNFDFEQMNIILLEFLQNKTSLSQSEISENFSQNFAEFFNKYTQDINKNFAEFIDDFKIILSNQNNDILINLLKEELFKQNFLQNSITKLSENNLFNILTNLFPIADIQYNDNSIFIIKRLNKPIIMIQNNDYNKNIDTIEIDNFKKNAQNLNSSAILLSQQYGIVQKENFQIDFFNNNIYIYIHNLQYSPDKIKIGIDIIDHFNSQTTSSPNKNINIDSFTLNLIHQEYNQFIKNKLLLLTNMDHFVKNIYKSINLIEFPNLDKYLNNCGLHSEHFNKWNCNICNRLFSTEKGLKNHNRSCKI